MRKDENFREVVGVFERVERNFSDSSHTLSLQGTKDQAHLGRDAEAAVQGGRGEFLL